MDYSHTMEVATKLRHEQMLRWLNTAKAPDDVFFHVMKLDKQITRDILSNPEFVTWTKYVDDFNAQYPDKETSIAPSLLKYFKSSDILNMAEAAKGTDETKSIPIKLEAGMIQVWLGARRTPDDALLELGLRKAAEPRDRRLDLPDELLAMFSRKSAVDTILENPLFSSWARYLDAYNAQYPQQKTTIIKTFTRTYGDVQVAEMVIVAKANTATRGLATKLESAQLEMWRSSEKSADNVFKLLQLHQPLVDFKGNLLLDKWLSYVNIYMYLKENPSKTLKLFSTLETRFKDRRLNLILQAAKKYPSMENTATKIQTEKFTAYAASHQDPNDMFQLLALDSVGDEILSDALFKSWKKYVEIFNLRNPNNPTSWFAPIQSHYNVEVMMKKAMRNPSTRTIGVELQREWVEYALKVNAPPKAVPQSLLHDAVPLGDILASPEFKTWTKYLKAFNEKHPNQETTILDGLRGNYQDKSLLEMFDAAKKDKGTKTLAAELQSALLNKWLDQKETPELLKRRYSNARGGGEMVERYIKLFSA